MVGHDNECVDKMHDASCNMIIIQNSSDHTSALEQLARRMLSDPELGSLTEAELVSLANAIERYEKVHLFIPRPTPAEARQFREEQRGTTSKTSLDDLKP